MRKNSATDQPHPALQHLCPFCGVRPGQPCRAHRGTGRELDRPHIRRMELNHPQPPTPATHLQALCCECGNLRTVSGNYSFRVSDPNRSDGGEAFGDQRGWRATGTLLCTNCGKPTRHAVLRGEDDRFRDYAEKMQRYVLGGGWGGQYPPDLGRIRERYFAVFPRNPFVRHKWWMSAEDSARQAGERWFPAMCGEPIELRESPSQGRADVTEMIAPTQVSDPDRSEEEYFDADTGLWWSDGWCVNCLKVRHDWLLEQHRDALRLELLEFSAVVDQLDAGAVAEVRDLLRRLTEVQR